MWVSMEMLVTALFVGVTCSLATFGLLYLYMRKAIPNLMQDVLTDVGEELKEIFANPTIKKAYSFMASQSHVARADNALREKVAGKIVGQSAVLGKALEYLDISPVEGLKLLNDPLLQPIIGGLLSGKGNLPNPGFPWREKTRETGARSNRVPEMR